MDIIERLQTKVSPSKLSLFQSCRLKFFFRYVLGLKKPKAAALQVGASVHATLKAWNRARWRQEVPAWNLLYPVYSAAWIAGQHDEPVLGKASKQTKRNKSKSAGGSWKPSSGSRPSVTPVSPMPSRWPWKLIFPATGCPLWWACSIWFRTRRIIDFKTSGSTPNADRAALVNGTQATAYSILYRENTGRKEAGVELHHLVKLKSPRLVVIYLSPVGDRECARLFRVIDAYVEGLGAARLHSLTGTAMRLLRVLPRMRRLALTTSSHHQTSESRSGHP